MTKRFDVEQVAEMLRCDASSVRQALSQLSEARRLSAESFLFADAVWRVAPSDVAAIQLIVRKLETQKSFLREEATRGARRVIVRARVRKTE